MGAGEVTDMKQTRTRALFATFFKIGAFTFGGGYAMVALLEHEFVEEKQWVTREEFLDMVAIAESTPGPMAVNSAMPRICIWGFICIRTAKKPATIPIGF